MKKILTILFLLFAVSSFAQTKYFVVHGDTLYLKNSDGSDSIQLNRFIPTQSGQSGKVLSTDGTNYQWIANSASVSWGGVTGTLSNQTDLQSALDGKQASGSYVAQATTVNGHALSGNVTVTPTDLSLVIGTNVQAYDADLTTYAGIAPSANIQSLLGSADYAAARTNLGLAIGTNVLAPNGSAASLTSFPTLNQNTSGTAAGLSAVLSFANGGISASAATSATTGTITVNMTTSVITCTPTGAMTLNASGGVAGQIITFEFTTSGTSSFTITFGTNFRKTGTLATGTTSARFFAVTFRCLDGTVWSEIGRTAAKT